MSLTTYDVNLNRIIIINLIRKTSLFYEKKHQKWVQHFIDILYLKRFISPMDIVSEEDSGFNEIFLCFRMFPNYYFTAILFSLLLEKPNGD